MAIGWTDDLSTGIAAIDSQHRELFGQIGTLEEAIHAGDLHQALDTLDFLEWYVEQHFAAEERAMTASKYDEYEGHKQRHDDFRTKLRTHRAEYNERRSLAALNLELADWLDGWLREHIRVADLRMAAYFRNRSGASAE